MKTKLKLAAFIGMAVSIGAAVAQPLSWTASSADGTTSALLSRWAWADGRLARWEARADFPILDAQSFNSSAKLTNATSTADAVSRVLALLRESSASKDGAPAPRDIGYFACFYAQGEVALVVRSMGQPGCETRLPEKNDARGSLT